MRKVRYKIFITTFVSLKTDFYNKIIINCYNIDCCGGFQANLIIILTQIYKVIF